MKQRIISGGVGICILIVLLCFYKTMILNISMSFISAIAVYELLVATGYLKNKLLASVCLFFSILVAFFNRYFTAKLVLLTFVILVFILLIVMLIDYKTVKIEHIGLMFFISVVIPFAFSMLICIRDKFENTPQVAMFYILLALGSAWVADSGAYFIGVFFGKTKLAPNISPKKTVEGLIGGLISAVIFGIVLSLVFSNLFYNFGISLHINFFRLLLVVPIASLIGVLGDLSASVIKRQCLIKDFGGIMPGHGGVLDRFDSVLFTIPFYYLIALFFSLVE